MQNLVLTHGLLCDASIWAHQSRALEKSANVVVPVYRSATRLEDMAAIALDSVEGDIAVAGHSMGARVALEMWRAAPERITRLALFDFGVGGVVDGEIEKRKVLTDLAADHGIGEVATEWVGSMVKPDRRDDSALVTPLHEMVRTYTPAQHAGQVAALLHRRDLWPLLPTITVPTLVAVGRQDPWRSVEHHEDIAAAVPGARLAVIEDCGHMAPVEQPDVVLDLLSDWLGIEPG
ncbi:MAG: alpha/beta fold hydrolase [Acidimicrobiia bacterium]